MQPGPGDFGFYGAGQLFTLGERVNLFFHCFLCWSREDCTAEETKFGSHKPKKQEMGSMKKMLGIGGLLIAAIGCANAQSSVTLWGRTNATMEHQSVNGVGSNKVVDNGSRWGIRATENLGGGLRAGAVLTAGFNIDTGAQQNPTSLFNRASEIYLSGSAGIVRLGRLTSEAYFATADYVSLHNHDTGTSSDALYAFPVAFARQADKIAYRTPALGGLTFEAATAMRESSSTRTYEAAARYTLGPLFVGAGYEKNGDKHQLAVSTLYAIDAFAVGGYIQRDKNAYASGERNTYRLIAKYTVGAEEFHVNYGRAGDYSGITGDSSAKQFTFAVNHNLSKRTKVYTFWTRKMDSDHALYGGSFSSIAVGVRHNF